MKQERTRKRSARITLVLLGAALVACNDQAERRDVYASKKDCVQDWGDETKCERAPDGAVTTNQPHSGGGYFWGPRYFGSYGGTGSSISSTSRGGNRAIGSQSVSRGGFGSSSSAHSSGS